MAHPVVFSESRKMCHKRSIVLSQVDVSFSADSVSTNCLAIHLEEGPDVVSSLLGPSYLFGPLAQEPSSRDSLLPAVQQADDEDQRMPPTCNLVHFDQLDFASLLTARKTYVCPLCPKEMRDKFCLKRHYMIHTGEKPYVCPHCPYKGNRKEELKLHIWRHHR